MWDKRQVRDFAKSAVGRARGSWGLLGPTMREGLVALEVLGVVTGQAAETVRVADVEQLWREVSEAAKTEATTE